MYFHVNQSLKYNQIINNNKCANLADEEISNVAVEKINLKFMDLDYIFIVHNETTDQILNSYFTYLHISYRK